MKPTPLTCCLAAVLLVLGQPDASGAAASSKIILDVDLAEDVDDAGALAVLHAMASRGEAEILGVLVSSKNEWVVPCVDAINTWYGRPDLPIGYQRGHQYGYRNAKDPDRDTPSQYAAAVAKAFPHDLNRSSDAPDAVLLSRRLLAAQPDQSVTIVTVGFLTNLRNLLDSRPDEHSKLDGEALVKQKVKQWVCMGGVFPGGRFPEGNGEYNLMYDTVASVRAINDWPTPIVFSGFEIGVRVKVGARLRETPEANPVRACYQHYHWTKHERILDNREVRWAKRAMWAPAAVERQGKYYLFFGANDVHEGEIGGIGVAVADQPEGPFKDLLGKPLVGQIVNGAQPIDQFVFQDKDGQDYLVYGGWSHCNIARLKPDFTGLLPFPDGTTFKEITPQNYVEGPCMFVRDGKYYFMWSEGGWTGPNYSVAYAIGNSPLGPFRRIGKILQQDPTVATGAGHHSVLNIPGTDEWYIVYHRRPLTETDANHRVTCIDRMAFDEQGQIKPVKITHGGVARRPLTPNP